MVDTVSRRLTLATALLAGSATTAAEPPEALAEAAPASVAAIEQEAVDALEGMSKYLRSMKVFAIQADISKDEVQEDGRKLQFDRQLDIVLNRGSGLRIYDRSSRKNRNFYYNGKVVTLYSPDTHYYATFQAPATVREMLDAAEEKYDITMPLSDIFLWGTEQAPTSGIEGAMVVGPSRVRGVDCTHYAYSAADVDWQLCIQPGDKPMPLKLVITTTELPEQPQYVAVMQWQPAPALEEGMFTFVPSPEATEISFQMPAKNAPAAN